MAPVRSLLTCAAVVLTCTAMVACGGKKGKDDEPELKVETPDLSVSAYGSATFVEPTVYTENLGLHAAAAPGRLLISVRNRRGDDVAVLQRDMALISGRELRQLDQSLVRAFTPAMVGPGALNMSQVVFHDPNFDASGMRLVYNNPRQNIKFYVVVD